MQPTAIHDRLLKLLACLLVAAGLQVPVYAQDKQRPLFEREPHYIISLDAVNNHMKYRIEPLKIPANPGQTDNLTVKLFHDPDDTASFKVQWIHIIKIEVFEDLVLKKANKLVAQKRLDEAYDYFEWLLDRGVKKLKDEKRKQPDTLIQRYESELNKSLQAYLFEEAKYLYQEKMHYGALAMMRELHEQNPVYPGLDRAMGAATDQLVSNYLTQKDYRSARKLIRNLNKAYPNHPVAVQGDKNLRAQATALFNQAQTAVGAGRHAEAGKFLRQVKQVYPAFPGAEELAQRIHTFYPRVVVGVQIRAVDPQPGCLNGWAEQRSGRLLYRTLMEYDGPGVAGGDYVCPVGNFDIDSVANTLSWQISPDIKWSSGDTILTGYQVARRLLDVANTSSDVYEVQWAKLLDGVSVSQVYSVEANLKYNFVRPDALLQTTLVPYGTPAEKDHPPLPNGPYVVASRNERDVVYLINSNYFKYLPGQPKELVERHFASGALAIEALKRGEIQVIDRIGPWAVDELRNVPELRVGKYGVPQVHCLIPNMRELPAEGPILMEQRDDPAEKFVSLRKAMRKALADENAQVILSAVDEMGDTLEMNPLIAKGKMLRDFADEADNPSKIGSLVTASKQYIDNAVAAGRLDLAMSIAKLATQACKPEQGSTYRNEAADRRRQVQKLYNEQRFRRALTSDRSFRRGLVYGVNREAILESLLHARAGRDYKVISGPFPPGVDLEDGLGYADDPRIRPRPYNWKMSLMLANMAMRRAIAAEKRGREIRGEPPNPQEELTSIPRLVLAYSGGEIAKTACEMIKLQLEPLGIPIELKQLPSPAPQQIPEDVDLLYAELAMWEPVVDARRLLGEKGLAGGCSSYMGLALRQLDKAAEWPEVRDILHDIHGIAHRDVAVVPLWQAVNYYACQNKAGSDEKGFFNTIGKGPITLYQHVEDWRPPFLYPEEEEE